MTEITVSGNKNGRIFNLQISKRYFDLFRSTDDVSISVKSKYAIAN